MRIPSLPNFVRTFYAFSNATFHRTAPAPFSLSAARPGIALRNSMPAIPFIGSLFHTAETRNMSHLVQKTDQEWQMQLNKGMFLLGLIACGKGRILTSHQQSNSAFSVTKAPKRLSLASTTSTPRAPAPMAAPAATHLFTPHNISSSLAVAGPLSSMPFPAL
jgi:hypothetical protein